ncbi:MAG: helix-turn-helix domain-containing protein [Flavobacteriales bacterium]|nr:helix-turn-helix domain-containing protein [Flavobacteriales bacterium]
MTETTEKKEASPAESDLSKYLTSLGSRGVLKCPIVAWLAKASGCGPGTLYMIARKHKQPSARLARRIEKATNGYVTAASLRPDIF